jgi:hypothetical protein
MGFTSLDDLLNQLTSGKYLRRESSKLITPVNTSGGWHCLASLGGYPNATTYPSAQDLVYQACTETGGDAAGACILGMQHGGLPGGTATKHAINVGGMVVGAAGAPWQLKLIDIQGYYRLSGANVTGTGSRAMINSNTVTFSNSGGSLLATYTNDFNNFSKVQFSNSGGSLPTGISALTDYWLVRQSATTAKIATTFANALAGTVITYTDSGAPTTTVRCFPNRYTNGVGCQAFFVAQTQPTAGGPNLSASAYDNTTDTPGSGTRAFQGSPTMGATADAYNARVIHSGNAAGRYGPFLPLQGGDLGIARVNSFTWSGGTAYTGSGVVALVIARPIFDLPVAVTGMWSERDLINQLPSAPKIEDGACLIWMLFGTGNTTNNSPVTTALDVAWGG